ncbi:glycosyltransferase family A protein [Sinomonas halotolerans]
MARVLRAQGRPVRLVRHLPRRGLAEHRQFLLEESAAERVLFMDDDVWLASGALRLLVQALDDLGCGFVGMPVQGLSYLGDRRPAELEPFELSDAPVEPEAIDRDAEAFGRWTLHNAANPAHLADSLAQSSGFGPRGWAAYRVAWIGGCVLYRRHALVECGGFGFWGELPPEHAGEDVVAQWRVMEQHGGAGILPSHAVHLESPTTVPVRDAEASEVLAGKE